MSCVKVANDNDGYGSGNMCQLLQLKVTNSNQQK